MKMKNLIDCGAFDMAKIANLSILDDQNKRVSLVNFPRGHGLKPHSAPVDVLVVGISGEAEVKINDHTMHMKPNDYIIFPANEKHSVEALTAFKMLIIK